MKITYNQILNRKIIPESKLYLIYGEPYHLINETESVIKKSLNVGTNFSTHYVDNDFSLDEISNDLESTSLFSTNDAVTLNIVSSSIPKKLSDYLQNVKFTDSITVIVKFKKSINLIKKNKFLDFVEKEHVLFEIRSLSNNNLDLWLKSKFNSVGIKCDNKLLELIKETHDGNTSAMSQEIYKISILKPERIEDYLSSTNITSKYSEFDLIDSILNQDQGKSLRILRYLRDSNISEVFLLYLLQNEVRKFLYLKQNISPQPYIPGFKQKQYKSVTSLFEHTILESLISHCFMLDKYIKSNSKMSYVWDNFEEMVVILTSPSHHDIIERGLSYEH